MTNAQKYVHRFMKKHREEPLPTYPIILSRQEAKLRVGMLLEEVFELAEAFADGDYLNQIKEICDVLYVAYGTLVAMGVDGEPFEQEVHRSNMTKDVGSKEKGFKVVKGEHYQAANIAGVYERLYVNAFMDDDGTADQTVTLLFDLSDVKL